MCEVRMITEFLSEESISLHKEYVRQKRLKYSILESYLPELRGASVADLFRLRMGKKDRADALSLLPEIVLHDVFFSSFCEEKNPSSRAIAELYGSEASFLNVLYRLALKHPYGFIGIGRRASVCVFSGDAEALRYDAPLLAIDLCEHAYFPDYGFDRERYLVEALSHLDLKKITT